MEIFTKQMYAILEGEDGKFYPHTFGGYSNLIIPSEFKIVLRDLMEYCDTYTDVQIMDINHKRSENWFSDYIKSNTKKVERDKTGYVYLLKCENKYKIGYSQNVERRIKQLDKKPFPLELVLKVYSDIALDIEQKLHKTLIEYNIRGEWYNSDILTIDIKALIKEIEEDLLCDTQ